MLLSDFLSQFDELTTSISFEVGPDFVRMSRRRDGVLENVADLNGSAMHNFVADLCQGVRTDERHLDVQAAFQHGETWYQYMGLNTSEGVLAAIIPWRDRGSRPLSERLQGADLAAVSRIVSPPEGVVVLCEPWCGKIGGPTASIVQHGWSGLERGFHVCDHPADRVPGLQRVMVDGSDVAALRRVLRFTRYSERLPVMISLYDETLAVQEAFRLAQLDYRVYVLTDSRPVCEAMSWLSGIIDPWVLSEYLSGIVHSICLPEMCQHCRRPDPAPDVNLLRRIGLRRDAAKKIVKAAGCELCYNCGIDFKRTRTVVETLNLRDDPHLASLIRARASRARLVAASKAARGATIQEKARALVRDGEADLRTVEHQCFRRRVNT